MADIIIKLHHPNTIRRAELTILLLKPPYSILSFVTAESVSFRRLPRIPVLHPKTSGFA
jgi:hypothetical protein